MHEQWRESETNPYKNVQTHYPQLDELGDYQYDLNEVLLQTPIEETTNPIRVQGIYYRYLNESIIPFLKVRGSQDQGFTIPLLGRIDLLFGKRYCLNCHQEINPQESIAYCDTCMNTKLYFMQCRFTEPGAPFQQECTIKNQPCYYQGGPVGCFNKHFLYLASIGQYIKVGISSEQRKDKRMYTRLIEQGITQAITVHSFPSLHEAMNAEKHVQKALNIPDFITGAQKTQALSQEELQLASRQSSYYTQIKQLYPDKELKIFNINEKPLFPFVQYIDPPPEHIQGDIIYAIGSLIVIETHTNHLFSINAKRLVGRTIIPWEEF